MRSTLSTPFCKVMTRVSGPTSGRVASAAFSVSHSLTANSTISTGPTLLGSSVTLTLGRCRSPCTLSSLRPFSLHGREIGAARDEEHVVAGRRHARAEITADRARRH